MITPERTSTCPAVCGFRMGPTQTLPSPLAVLTQMLRTAVLLFLKLRTIKKTLPSRCYLASCPCTLSTLQRQATQEVLVPQDHVTSVLQMISLLWAPSVRRSGCRCANTYKIYCCPPPTAWFVSCILQKRDSPVRVKQVPMRHRALSISKPSVRLLPRWRSL